MTASGRTHRHVVRTADGRYTELKMTRKLAMSAFCTECLGFEINPKDCTSKTCPMYPFRSRTEATLKGTIDTLAGESRCVSNDESEVSE